MNQSPARNKERGAESVRGFSAGLRFWLTAIVLLLPVQRTYALMSHEHLAVAGTIWEIPF